jgi:hypothetical protein
VRIIAEIKKASPSRGMLAEHLDAVAIARAYSRPVRRRSRGNRPNSSSVRANGSGRCAWPRRASGERHFPERTPSSTPTTSWKRGPTAPTTSADRRDPRRRALST